MYKIISKLKNKKGASTIEIVIGLMIFILIFGFMLDLISLTWKFNVIAQTNTQLARVAGIQGGVLGGPPTSWPGGSGSYVSSSEMRNTINNSFASASIDESDVTIGFPFGRRYEYGDTFETSITVRYKWEYISMMLPGTFEQEVTSVRPAMSEWKYNYNNWVGE